MGKRNKTQIPSALDSSRHLITFYLFIFVVLSHLQIPAIENTTNICHKCQFALVTAFLNICNALVKLCLGGSLQRLWGAREERVLMTVIQKFVTPLCRPVGDGMSKVCHVFFFLKTC